MPGIVDHLSTAREALTADQIWAELVAMRANGIEAKDLPLTKGELLRVLRMYKFAGGLADVDGKWAVVRKAVKREPQKAWF